MDSINLLWAIAKPLLFRMDPEKAHHLTLRLLKMMPQRPPATQGKTVYGLGFANRVGLAAGMDKNAECLTAWQSLGFGFVEVGTVTAQPQTGNPKPRLFRLLKHQALYNRMGFNNDGARVISQRIAEQRKKCDIRIPIGINIGKSAVVPLEDAARDYLMSFDMLADLADYITINVSSPNTKDLRKLQAPRSLAQILEPLTSRNHKRQKPKLLLVKIAPDLEEAEAIAICREAMSAGADGFIISNTTVQHHEIDNLPSGGGGLSGAPLFKASTQLLANIREAIGPQPLIIGSGGIMTPKDASAKLAHGANLVQIYSGLVYAGPGLIRACIKACDDIENSISDVVLGSALKHDLSSLTINEHKFI